MRQRPLIQSPPKPKSTRSVCSRTYVWVYSTTPYSARKTVVYDFSPSRAGEHAPNFLGPGNGKLICDDFAGYKPVSRKVSLKLVKWPTPDASLDLYVANKSQLAEQTLHSIGGLMDIIEKNPQINFPSIVVAPYILNVSVCTWEGSAFPSADA